MSQTLDNLSYTWNNAGTTFTGIKYNVTDTASASGSLLMNLQVGGTSKFSVSKVGAVTAIGSVTGANGDGAISTGGVYAWSSGYIGFSSGTSFGNANADVLLRRDAANTLAQRNGTNAQEFRLYNTYTDASNYERGFLKWDTNVLKIGTAKAGTGSARNLAFEIDGTIRLDYGVSNSGAWSFVGSVSTNGSFTAGAGFSLGWNGRSTAQSPSNGVITLTNMAASDFGRLQLGGTTSSFPALKRNTTALEAVLADDSGYTNIKGKLTTDTAYAAGAPTATGYLTVYDSTGTAYKIPAVAA